MVTNKKPQTPRCGICKRLYSSRDEDGSGLCPKCRPIGGVTVLNIRPEPPKTKGVGDMDFDQNQITATEGANEGQEVRHDTNSGELPDSVPPAAGGELKIEDLILPGKKGVTNFQMIPAIHKAYETQSVKQMQLLKTHYPSVFEGSIRYIKKKEREYIEANMK